MYLNFNQRTGGYGNDSGEGPVSSHFTRLISKGGDPNGGGIQSFILLTIIIIKKRNK